MTLANLIIAALLLLNIVVTYVPIRRDPITGWNFAVGWIVSELAGQILAVYVVVTGILVVFGGWRGSLGLAALILNVLVVLGLGGLLISALSARRAVEKALEGIPGFGVSISKDEHRPRWGRWWRIARAIPLPSRDLEIIKNVSYADDGLKAHRLDIIKSKITTSNAPVLLYIHGGSWVLGDKREQGKPMMFELAARGWVCVTANYRLSPKNTWPDHIVDVMKAIAWVKEHIAEHGGDPNFVAISGGSAGGHLCALAALAHDDPAFKWGFEEADTSVVACVPFYGVHDMTATKEVGGRYGKGLKVLLEREVMKEKMSDHPALFEAASPLHRVRADAPPFLVFHGVNDTLVPIAVPRAFVPALRAVSSQPVGYVELPLAQHAFDVMASPRCSATTMGVVAFLEALRTRTS
jgi:acetyl esterase/lipase